DEATASLIKWHQEQQAGGQFAHEIDEARKALVSLNAELPKTAKLTEFFTVLQTATGVNLLGLLPKSLKETLDKTNELADAIKAAEADRTATINKAVADRDHAYVQDLANLVSSDHATAQEYQTALALIKGFQDALTHLTATNPSDVAGRTGLIKDITALKEALHLDVLDDVNASMAQADATMKRFDATTVQTAKDLAPLKAVYDDTAGAIARFTKATQDSLNAQKIKPAKIPDDPQIQAIKYKQEMEQIWRDGIGKITTDGFKSFQDFFDDVFQLFSRLMQRMQAEGKASGLGYQLLGAGAAGISGGLTGYQVGLASGGNYATGGFGGAVSGAATGFAIAGPLGAAVGGLAGLAGGILGAGKAAEQAAAQMRQLRESLDASLTAVRVKLGDISDEQGQIEATHIQFQQLRDQLLATKPTMSDYERGLADINDLEARRIQQIKDEAKAVNDANNARIQQMVEESARETAALRLQEALAAFQEFSDQQQASLQLLAASRAAAQRDAENYAQQQLDATQKLLSVAEDQLSTQKDLVDGLQRTVDALRNYQDSLKLDNNLSPLTPEDRYLEAKRQYDVVAAQAAAGDQNAAQKLPDYANAFLQESRSMFASSDRYVQDYKQVQAFIGTLTVQYDDQLSVAKDQLDVLVRQADTLTALVGIQQEMLDRIAHPERYEDHTHDYEKNAYDQYDRHPNDPNFGYPGPGPIAPLPRIPNPGGRTTPAIGASSIGATPSNDFANESRVNTLIRATIASGKATESRLVELSQQNASLSTEIQLSRGIADGNADRTVRRI
ncbi:MAG TPA: hypothetical protein VIR54_24855, partial [Vicinamibacterales bacterium]